MTAVVVAQGFVILLLVVLVVGLLRSHAEILRRLHELGAGVYDEEAPVATAPVTLAEPEIRTRPGVPGPRTEAGGVHDLMGTTPAGAARSVQVAGVGHGTLLAFLSSGCATCREFWQAFAAGEAARLPGRDTRLVIVTKSPEDESISAVAALATDQITTLMTTRAYEDYGVPVSPYFILVDGPTSQVVGEGAAASWGQVLNLLRQAAADAGMDLDRPSLDASASSARRARQGGREREARADAELAAAGIGPGHPSLYQSAFDPDPTAADPGPTTSVEATGLDEATADPGAGETPR
jgi:hypothetical protein